MENLMNLGNEMKKELNEFVQNYLNNVEQGIQAELEQIEREIVKVSDTLAKQIEDLGVVATSVTIPDEIRRLEEALFEEAAKRTDELERRKEEVESLRTKTKDSQNDELQKKVIGIREQLEKAVVGLEKQLNTPIKVLEAQIKGEIANLQAEREKTLEPLNNRIQQLQLSIIEEAKKEHNENEVLRLQAKIEEHERDKKLINDKYDKKIETLENQIYVDREKIKNKITEYEKLIKNAQYVENHQGQFEMKEMNDALFSTLIDERENAKIALTTAEVKALEGAVNTILARGFKNILANSTLGIENTGNLSADRLFDLLERLGIVGPVSEYGGNSRPVLVSREELTEKKIKELIDKNIRIEPATSTIRREQRTNSKETARNVIGAEQLKTAVREVSRMENISIVELNKRLKYGFDESAKIVKILEEMGIVSPFDGSKQRKILMPKDQLTVEKIDALVNTYFNKEKGTTKAEETTVEETAEAEVVEEPAAAEIAAAETAAAETAAAETAAEIAAAETAAAEVVEEPAVEETPVEETLSNEQLLDIFNTYKSTIGIWMGASSCIERQLGISSESLSESLKINKMFMDLLDESHRINLASICKSVNDREEIGKYKSELTKYFESNLKNSLIEFVGKLKEKEKIKKVIQEIAGMNSISIMELNNKFKGGLSESAKMMECLQQLGIVGQVKGLGPKPLLLTKEQLTEEKIDALVNEYFNIEKGTTKAEETPVAETPVEETPVEETLVEETLVEETPVEETPVAETPVEETPVEETLVEETPVAETPVEETPVEETLVEETPVAETTVEETPVEETLVEETPVEETLSNEQLLGIFNTYKNSIGIWMGNCECIESQLGKDSDSININAKFMDLLDEKHKIELASICKSVKDEKEIRKYESELTEYFDNNLKDDLYKFIEDYLLKQPIDIHVNEHGISINGKNIDPETISGPQDNTVEGYIDELLNENGNYDMNIIRAIVINDKPTVIDGKCELSEIASKRLENYRNMIDYPEVYMGDGKITYDLKKMSGLRGLLAGSKWEKDDVDEIKESAKIAEELGCATVNVGFLTRVLWGIRRAIEGNNTPLIGESTEEKQEVEDPKVEEQQDEQPKGPTTRVQSAVLTQAQYEEQQHHQQATAKAFSKSGEHGGKEYKKSEDIDIPF